ncbi:metallophosphoesterase [Arcticibacter sp. MXS-1]|uniref:metallophosphoesterase family protein n=1 Tax=Arcticibacter sp. MXS-1 TaxID=3341726 RepID=UPI0035A8FB56
MEKPLLLIILALLCLFYSCNGLEYSPNQVFDNNSPRDLNRKNIERLLSSPGDDTVRFVLTGDSQREYSYSKDLVATINRIPGVDFVLLAGDISDFGLLQEMEWITSIFSKLTMPYIGVIGNHDLVANGEKVYRRMFGELNFTFTYQGIKFICHDSNSREAYFNGKVPDVEWLHTQFEDSPGVKGIITVAHVPPGNSDFDERLYEPYVNVINGSSKTLAALFAHIHTTNVFYPRQDRVPYIVTNAIEHRQFELIEIVDGKLSRQTISF